MCTPHVRVVHWRSCLQQLGAVLCLLLGGALGLSAQCTLVCPATLNLSLPGPSDDCTAVVTAAGLGASVSSCQGVLHVDLYTASGTRLPSDTSATGARIGRLTAQHVGATLVAHITHDASGQRCDVGVHVFDAQAPLLTVSDTAVSVVADLTPAAGFPAAQVRDCSTAGRSYQDSLVTHGCAGLTDPAGNPVFQTVYRTWLATDAANNSSTARQRIQRLAVSLDSVYAPRDTTLSCSHGTVANETFATRVPSPR